MADFARENTQAGPRNYRDWIAREKNLRLRVATFIGAHSGEDIALLKNTTEGICTVAFGYPWQAGDNVVIPEGEFPSNRLPWLAQEKHGIEIREVDLRGPDEPEDALIASIDEGTRILAVSSVQYSDGLRLNLGKLGAACRETETFFFVDAIQHLGALSMNAEECHIDCLAADAHKWMLGPEGIAIFYCREPLRSKLELNQVGWHMYDNPWIFERPDWSPSSSAKRFEAGTPNTIGQVALSACLDLFQELGTRKIENAVLRNSEMLLRGLSDLPGVELRSSGERKRLSGIVSFEIRNRNLREVYGRMTRAGVDCALRGGSLRLSPHFYQDEQVMEKLLEIVEGAL